MPSAGLLFQALASGVFLGSLYGLIGLGVGLGWGLLRQINLAHFAWVFLSAYITYELKTRLGVDPLLSLLLLVPVFAALGMAVQSLLMRFAITPFNSLLVTFGMTVSVEALLQWIWSADYRRMASLYEEHKFRLGSVVVTYSETITFCLSLLLAGLVWAIIQPLSISVLLKLSIRVTQLVHVTFLRVKFNQEPFGLMTMLRVRRLRPLVMRLLQVHFQLWPIQAR